MAKPRNWAALSDGQRKRYVSAGRTGTLTGTKGLTPAQVKKYYERGGSLSAGRGHKEEIRAPRKIALKASTGNVSSTERQTLKQWRKSKNYPDWLPRSNAVMRDDVAAALSLLGTQPKNWKSLVVRENTDGSGTYSVIVTTKRGATRTTELPDKEAVKEFAALLKNQSQQGRTKKEKQELVDPWAGTAFDVNFVYSLDMGGEKQAIELNTMKVTGNALPTKRKTK
jgi:hypothetical protein